MTPQVGLAESGSVPPPSPTASLFRRMACFLYEGVLLFGVVWMGAMVYGVATQQRHALIGSLGLKISLGLLLAAYFVYFWSRKGQTLAMLTWHIKLVTVQGQAVSPARALCRYVLSWLWFVPALASLHFSGVKGAWPTFGSLILGVLAYAALTRLHPDRQYWHDAVCQTRLITWQPAQLKR